MSFETLGLSETLLRAVREQGYDTPSPIQTRAIPLVLAGRDLMAAAQTGTGKTAAFTLPILQRLAEGNAPRARHIRALILTPTRELAAQVQASTAGYGRHQRLRSAVVFGGVNIKPQIEELRRGIDVLVATPGRLLDLHGQGALSFDGLEILVLDEADRMLDMGFIHDIRRIVKLLPQQRQTLMFSATFSKEIRELATGYLKDPARVEVSPRNATADTVRQYVYTVDKQRKPALLSHLVRDNNWSQVLIFTRTKHGANRLCQQLEKDGIRAAAIHGNKSQGARTRALESFKRGKLQALVATDIAARGLDIEQLPQVVNFELPNVAEDYVHRIGRTGRAGSAGHAYSLVSADEADHLHGIEKLIRKKLPREEIDGFEPTHTIPEGKLSGANRRNSNRREPEQRNREKHSSGQNPRDGHRNGRGNDARRAEGNRNARRRKGRANKSAAA
jgi:ATP-dependent RNA helicase RhlE